MGDIKTRFALEGESQFRSAMNNAASAIKVLNAEQKLAAATFRQTGDAEKYAATQADILKQKISQQKAAVQAAEQALKGLTEGGVTSGKQFQQWQTKLYNAQTALANMETELQNVNSTMQQTTTQAGDTGQAIESIGKKVSFDTVINGIGRITGVMEAAAQKAKELALEVVNFTKDAASQADDIATTATVYGFTTQEVQQMRYTADILDTSFESIVKSRQKLVNAMQSDSDVFSQLGVQIREAGLDGDNGSLLGNLRSWEDVFWDVGDALMRIEKDKGFEYVNKQAQQLFGRGWEQLKPIFNSDWASEDNRLGKAFSSAREYYEAVMASWDVNSDETIKKLTSYDDAIHTLENNLKTLENTVAGELAPGFEKVTTFISELVTQFNKYLESDEGKKKMESLNEAIVTLFTKLTDIDFGKALDTAKSAIDGLTSGLTWLSEHGGEVKGVIEGLAVAFGALKVSESVLRFTQNLSAWKYLFNNTNNPPTETVRPTATPAGENTAARFAVPASVNQAALAVGSWANSTNLTNAGVVWDWFTHDTDTGRWLSNVFSKMLGGTEQYATDGAFSEVSKWWESVKQNWKDLTQGPHAGESWLGSLWNSLFAGDEFSSQTSGSHGFFPEGGVKVKVDPEAPADAAASIAGQVGTVVLPARLVWDRTIGGAGGGYDWNVRTQRANGLPYVPFDGYPAILHKGEAVVPARQIQSRSYNSNLYVENMHMNSGIDAEGLAAAMASAQRRTLNGYGS